MFGWSEGSKSVYKAGIGASFDLLFSEIRFGKAAIEGAGTLASRARQIHGALDPIAQTQRTTAILPRMFAVQADGCAPIVRAFERGERHAERWEDARTVASGVRVPHAVGDFLILDAVRESGGAALVVSDEAILAAVHEAAGDGLLLCPEGGATLAAWKRAQDEGMVGRDERCVLFNCATGSNIRCPTSRDRSTVSHRSTWRRSSGTERCASRRSSPVRSSRRSSPVRSSRRRASDRSEGRSPRLAATVANGPCRAG